MFDYLAILICVILGLALTHLLIGVSRLMQIRHEIRIYWVQLAWIFNIVLYILALWWGMFWWKHLKTWTVQEFFFLSLYTIVVFLLASALFPHECSAGHDCEDYFFRNKSWFFGLLIAALLFDLPETLLKSLTGLRGVPIQYFLFLPGVILIGVVGLLSNNRRVHAALPLLWLAAIVAYETATSIDRIVAV